MGAFIVALDNISYELLILVYCYFLGEFLWLGGGQEAIPYTNTEITHNPFVAIKQYSRRM